MYTNPALAYPTEPEKNSQEAFDEFYEDIYDELSGYGEVEELNVCDNVCDHMLGNVYVKYANEEDAQKCLQALTGRFYGGRPIVPEFSPVTDFREASCRQHDLNECNRGGRCNFIHLRFPSRELGRELFGSRWRGRRKDEKDDRRHYKDDRRDNRRRGDRDDRRNFRRSRSPRGKDRRYDRYDSPRKDSPAEYKDHPRRSSREPRND